MAWAARGTSVCTASLGLWPENLPLLFTWSWGKLSPFLAVLFSHGSRMADWWTSGVTVWVLVTVSLWSGSAVCHHGWNRSTAIRFCQDLTRPRLLLPVKVGKTGTHRAYWQKSCGSKSSRKTWETCWYFPFFFSRTKEVASEGPSKISRQNYWQELVSLQAGLSASFWNAHGQRKL